MNPERTEAIANEVSRNVAKASVLRVLAAFGVEGATPRELNGIIKTFQYIFPNFFYINIFINIF